MSAVLEAIDKSALAELVRSSSWIFPLMETLHFVGLCLLLGAVMLMDVRLLGFARRLSIPAALQLIPLAICGFAINAVSGVLFFVSDPVGYASNTGFILKMILILIAGCNALWFEFGERRQLLALNGAAPVPRTIQVIAFGSLTIWIAVLALGRLLPYTIVP